MHLPMTATPPGRRVWLSSVAAAVALVAVALALMPGVARAQTATPTLPSTLETAVRTQVATQAGVEPAAVTINRAVRVVWGDGCLGVQTQGVACTQALVSGWVVWATGGTSTYRLHTDYDGSDVRVASSTVADAATDPLPSGATEFQSNVDALPEAVQTQLRTLAATRAGVDASQVTVLRVEEVEWADACVGAAQAGEQCAEVITPGFVVWVSAGTNVYRYHTSDQATNVRFAEQGLDIGDIPIFELPEGASAPTPGTDGLIVGDVPTSGLGLLMASAEATPSDLVTGLVAQGCAPVSIGITVGGEFVIYIPGAPAFVNAEFPASLAADTGFIVRCA